MENDSGVGRENSENHESREKPEAGAGKRRRHFTRHGYLRDFIRNDRGEYLYDGDVYCYNTPEIPFQSAFLRLLLLSCGAFLAQIAHRGQLLRHGGNTVCKIYEIAL